MELLRRLRKEEELFQKRSSGSYLSYFPLERKANQQLVKAIEESHLLNYVLTLSTRALQRDISTRVPDCTPSPVSRSSWEKSPGTCSVDDMMEDLQRGWQLNSGNVILSVWKEYFKEDQETSMQQRFKRINDMMEHLVPRGYVRPGWRTPTFEAMESEDRTSMPQRDQGALMQDLYRVAEANVPISEVPSFGLQNHPGAFAYLVGCTLEYKGAERTVYCKSGGEDILASGQRCLVLAVGTNLMELLAEDGKMDGESFSSSFDGWFPSSTASSLESRSNGFDLSRESPVLTKVRLKPIRMSTRGLARICASCADETELWGPRLLCAQCEEQLCHHYGDDVMKVTVNRWLTCHRVELLFQYRGASPIQHPPCKLDDVDKIVRERKRQNSYIRAERRLQKDRLCGTSGGSGWTGEQHGQQWQHGQPTLAAWATRATWQCCQNWQHWQHWQHCPQTHHSLQGWSGSQLYGFHTNPSFTPGMSSTMGSTMTCNNSATMGWPMGSTMTFNGGIRPGCDPIRNFRPPPGLTLPG